MNGHRTVAHTWIPMTDGVRLSAKLWLPESPGDRRPGDPRVRAVSQGRRDGGGRRADVRLLRGTRLRLRASRHAGLRRLRRHPRGRVPRAGAGRRASRCSRGSPRSRGADGRVGMIGHLVDRLQRPAGRIPPPTAAEGRDQHVLDRRPLSRRHPLHGRLRARCRHALVGDDDARLQRPPSAARVRRRRLARDLAAPASTETPPFVEEWLSHQRRDAFWKHGSICESYNTIECPLLMVGGWADAYRNAVLRVLEHYDGPCRGLIGPVVAPHPASTPGRARRSASSRSASAGGITG